MQVIKNVVHVAVSGLFATYYFMAVPDPSQPGKHSLSVRNPTAKAAGRAVTTSFGSICYGSLIIAIIQLIRSLIRSAADQSARDGNILAFFCLYCVLCCLDMIEAIAQYFNKVIFLFVALSLQPSQLRQYAFTQVAIYGKDYCTAGKVIFLIPCT